MEANLARPYTVAEIFEIITEWEKYKTQRTTGIVNTIERILEAIDNYKPIAGGRCTSCGQDTLSHIAITDAMWLIYHIGAVCRAHKMVTRDEIRVPPQNDSQPGKPGPSPKKQKKPKKTATNPQ